jgi:sulfonate transport system ATP-binding protein
MSALVTVRALERRYTQKGILHGVDLDIADGEFVALLGRSGCGKSTLLRAIANIDHEASGDGEIHVPVETAVVFQDSRLLPWKRVLDNVIMGVRTRDARDRGLAALRDMSLEERHHAWPSELSGGEQQRVALARALVREPRLLLADEPFGALDALTKIQMHSLLKRVAAKYELSVLFVTHDVDEAISLADRVLVMDHGQIIHQSIVTLPEERGAYAIAFEDHKAAILDALGMNL